MDYHHNRIAQLNRTIYNDDTQAVYTVSVRPVARQSSWLSFILFIVTVFIVGFVVGMGVMLTLLTR